MIFVLRASTNGAASKEEFIAQVDWKRIERAPVMNYDVPVSFRSYAMDRLESLTGRRQYDNDPAVFSILEMMFEPEVWDDRPILDVHDRDAQAILGAKRVSLKRIAETGILSQLQELAHRESMAQAGRMGGEAKGAEKPSQPPVVQLLDRARSLHEAIAGASDSFALIPTRNLRGEPGEWISARQAESIQHGERYPALVAAFHAAAKAFRERDAPAFQAAFNDLEKARRALPEWADVPEGRVRLDWIVSRLNPFYWAVWVSALSAAGFAALFSRRFRESRAVWSAAQAALLMAVLLQAAGIVARGIIVQRMPLANLYESLVFAIAGMAAFAAIFEALTRRAYFGLGGALLGAVFSAMGAALPAHMLRPTHIVPALQSYWLHIHVSVIMLSYSCFALSFFLCVAYLLRFARLESGEAVQEDETLAFLERLNFRAIIVGFPLLTLGIVLGAIWANTAWQRPWGWDPKEVWAAVTWIIYAIYIHARLVYRTQRLLFILLALLGFLAVLFTYLGVSFLLPGLHAYA